MKSKSIYLLQRNGNIINSEFAFIHVYEALLKLLNETERKEVASYRTLTRHLNLKGEFEYRSPSGMIYRIMTMKPTGRKYNA